MSRLVVGPFNRVEGDLEVRLDIEGGMVRGAKVVSPMYRGFETIMLDRPAIDSLTITPRICGICSVSQSVAAANALSDMSGVKAPRNGVFATQLAHACENLTDHLTHFYLFFMPDFAREVYVDKDWYTEALKRFQVRGGGSRANAMTARAKFLHVTGLIAGKWPHTLAIQPGGTTSPLDQGERIRLLAAIDGFRRFLERSVFGVPLEVFRDIDNLGSLRRWAESNGRNTDLGCFVAIADDLDLWSAGRGADHLMSFGAYPLPDGKVFAEGVWQNGKIHRLDTSTIREGNAFALYSGEPEHPFDGETHVAPEKEGAYSWCRAPRYDGAPVEVGAYARQLVDGQALISSIHAAFGSSVGGRILARWVEIARIVPQMEIWAKMLEGQEDYFVETTLPKSGRGEGLTEAARGALGHWVSVEHGLVKNYQIIAPTTWNFSPQDSCGVPGPLEAALVGASVLEGEVSPIAVQHIVRSFDPCMVCTAH